MARGEGFEPAGSGQQPPHSNGNAVALRDWGGSTTGVGVFGTSGAPCPGADNTPANIAGVGGHSIQNAGPQPPGRAMVGGRGASAAAARDEAFDRSRPV